MATAVFTAATDANCQFIEALEANMVAQLRQSWYQLRSIWGLADFPKVGAGIIENLFFDTSGSDKISLPLNTHAYELSINFENSRNGQPQDGESGSRNDSASRDCSPPTNQGLSGFPEQTLFQVFAVREMLEVELIGLAARKCQLSDLLPLRRVLEEMASTPAGERSNRYIQLDCDFHMEIAKLSGNCVMATMLRAVMEEFVPFLQKMSWSEMRSIQTDESHAKLYSLLVDGDVESAQQEMRSHLKTALNAICAEIRSSSEESE